MIQQIQRLETGVQHAVVSHIKEVTDNPDNVYIFEWEDIEAMSKAQLEAECRRMYLYLQKIAKERDEYHLARIDLSHERDFYMEQFSMVANVKRTPSRTPSFLRSPPDQSELETQQITDLKRKLRVQQEQLDSKVVQLQEVQEELEKHKEQVHRLHSEKRQLSKDAQKVRVYKDEVEVLRAKASEVEQLLNENKKLRNMVEDVDYLKKKVQVMFV
jgi:chromosome segregation ATPase